MNKPFWMARCTVAAGMWVAQSVFAGSLDPVEPPGPTMKTLQEIYEQLDAMHGEMSGGDAVAGEILAGRKAWVAGAEVTGSMPDVGVQDVMPGTTAQPISRGYHDGTGEVAGDPDLAAENIKKDVVIFGVTGNREGGEIVYTNATAALPRTGQTNSYMTGDDGALERGVAWPDPRFTVQADTNCVLDNLTGLVWARNANLPGQLSWSNAVAFCSGLDYGGSTEWRLPNVNELESLTDYRNIWPVLPSGHPFVNVQSDAYWTSSTRADNGQQAWIVLLAQGGRAGVNKVGAPGLWVWPVRGGQ
jgi:hypothetical protein